MNRQGIALAAALVWVAPAVLLAEPALEQLRKAAPEAANDWGEKLPAPDKVRQLRASIERNSADLQGVKFGNVPQEFIGWMKTVVRRVEAGEPPDFRDILALALELEAKLGNKVPAEGHILQLGRDGQAREVDVSGLFGKYANAYQAANPLAWPGRGGVLRTHSGLTAFGLADGTGNGIRLYRIGSTGAVAAIVSKRTPLDSNDEESHFAFDSNGAPLPTDNGWTSRNRLRRAVARDAEGKGVAIDRDVQIVGHGDSPYWSGVTFKQGDRYYTVDPSSLELVLVGNPPYAVEQIRRQGTKISRVRQFVQTFHPHFHKVVYRRHTRLLHDDRSPFERLEEKLTEALEPVLAGIDYAGEGPSEPGHTVGRYDLVFESDGRTLRDMKCENRRDCVRAKWTDGGRILIEDTEEVVPVLGEDEIYKK